MDAGETTGGPKAADDDLAPSPEALCQSYERLRQGVLGADPGNWRLGHGVVVTRGVAAWMAACTATGKAPATEMAAPALSLESLFSSPTQRVPSSRPSVNPIVTVLAQMVLAHA